MFFFRHFLHTAAKVRERLVSSNVSLVFLSILFHLACVLKRAVCPTLQLRIERQLIFWGGYMFFFHHFPHTAAKARESDFFWTRVLFSLVFAHGVAEAPKA